jgi:hypothetical protein
MIKKLILLCLAICFVCSCGNYKRPTGKIVPYTKDEDSIFYKIANYKSTIHKDTDSVCSLCGRPIDYSTGNSTSNGLIQQTMIRSFHVSHSFH